MCDLPVPQPSPIDKHSRSPPPLTLLCIPPLSRSPFVLLPHTTIPPFPSPSSLLMPPLPDPLQSPTDCRSRVADFCPSQMFDSAEVCGGYCVWSRWGWSRDKFLAFPVLLQFFPSLLPTLLSHFADFWSWRPPTPMTAGRLRRPPHPQIPPNPAFWGGKLGETFPTLPRRYCSHFFLL